MDYFGRKSQKIAKRSLPPAASVFTPRPPFRLKGY